MSDVSVEQTRPDPLSRPFKQPPKAGEVLAADMRAMIIGNGLPEGTPLESETELIKRTGLSRASVREALASPLISR